MKVKFTDDIENLSPLSACDRVRYSRVGDAKKPKNTLFTYLRDGEENVFFGIARCNNKADKFVKQKGRRIAEDRAEKVEDDLIAPEGRQTYSNVGGMIIHSSGLRGLVQKSNIRELLDYFKTIDDRFVKQLSSSKTNEDVNA